MARKIDEDLMNAIMSAVSKKEKTGYEVYKELKKAGERYRAGLSTTIFMSRSGTEK